VHSDEEIEFGEKKEKEREKNYPNISPGMQTSLHVTVAVAFQTNSISEGPCIASVSFLAVCLRLNSQESRSTRPCDTLSPLVADERVLN
jgi:hypothetical protein